MSVAPANTHKKLAFVDPATFTPHFSWKALAGKVQHGAEVICDGVSLAAIAGKFGTPAYVFGSLGVSSGRSSMAHLPNTAVAYPRALSISATVTSSGRKETFRSLPLIVV